MPRARFLLAWRHSVFYIYFYETEVQPIRARVKWHLFSKRLYFKSILYWYTIILKILKIMTPKSSWRELYKVELLYSFYKASFYFSSFETLTKDSNLCHKTRRDISRLWKCLILKFHIAIALHIHMKLSKSFMQKLSIAILSLIWNRS